MGLSIFYTFEFRGTKAALVKKLEWLRDRYEDFPVNHVGDIYEIKHARLERGFGKRGKELFSENMLGLMMSLSYFPETKTDKALMALMKRAGGASKILELPLRDRKRFQRLRKQSKADWERRVERIRKSANGLLLTVDVGEGCESFDIMLGRMGNGRIWKGQRFTKTQYATHFHTAHLAVCEMLDLCRDAGILKSVQDDGHFFENRNIQELAKNINKWTESTRMIADALKSAGERKGFNVVASIDKATNIMKVTKKKPGSNDK